MAIFVFTADFIKNLPETNYKIVFGSILLNMNQILVDNLSKVRNCYCSIIENEQCTCPYKLFHWFSLLGFLETYPKCEEGVKIVDIEEENFEETNLFLEVSKAANNLTGMVINDFQKTSLTIQNGSCLYEGKNIDVLDTMELMNKILPRDIDITLIIQYANKITKSPINYK